MIEVHNQPELALSDSAQALTLSEYAQLIEEVRAIRSLMASDGDGSLKAT
jgi:3-deoxy-D-arabino-heptulosonate 7-phosphate (DAHP) synthase